MHYVCKTVDELLKAGVETTVSICSRNESWNVTPEAHFCVVHNFAGTPVTPATAETIRGVSSPDLTQSSLWIVTLLPSLQNLWKLYEAVTVHTPLAKCSSNIWYVPCQISLECSCSFASSSHNSTEWKMIPNRLLWAWICIYTRRDTRYLLLSCHKITASEWFVDNYHTCYRLPLQRTWFLLLARPLMPLELPKTAALAPPALRLPSLGLRSIARFPPRQILTLSLAIWCTYLLLPFTRMYLLLSVPVTKIWGGTERGIHFIFLCILHFFSFGAVSLLWKGTACLCNQLKTLLHQPANSQFTDPVPL